MANQNPRYPHPPGCRGCSLDSIGFGFAPPSGPPDARLVFIGEALGWEEAIAGEPFYGAAGGVLSRLCTRAGIERRHVRIANVVSCRPPGDYLVGAAWEEHAISQCRQYLDPVLADVPDNAVVVPLGATALTTVLGLRGVEGVSVKDFHGTVSRSVDDRYWVVPTFHPSHLQRGAMNLIEVVSQDLRLADRIGQRGFVRSPSELVVDPHPDWLRGWVDRYLGDVAADPEGYHLALDTEFAEKAGGADESEVVLGDGTSPITRVNGGRDQRLGWTVPYRQPYIAILEDLLRGVGAQRGWLWLWNKYADLDHLRRAGHRLDGIQAVDAMWLWHYLQSDLPRGLGFVAPMASDFGAWKHWGKQKHLEGQYAAADGVQTWRTSMWLLKAAIDQGIWDIFLTDWHERDEYVLRPAHDLGTPVNRQSLENFHEELQRKLASVLERIKLTAAQGVLKPKLGYAKKPKSDVPPKTVLGKLVAGDAKATYMLEGVRLVEREVDVEILVCVGCGATEVGQRHRCRTPKAARRRKNDPIVVVDPPAAQLEARHVLRPRYFWQLPFNPDAPAQILAYLASQNIAAPVDKKTKRATTNKKALDQLKQQHRDDPFFQLQMDWKAVQKVDSTYAVGSLAKLDADDRLHPEFLPKPSTFRDSCQNPNLQNVVADKAGAEGLAAGFRKCIEARDGVPAGTTAEQLAAWETRWPI